MLELAQNNVRDDAQQECAETPARAVGPAPDARFDEPQKKLLGKILGLRFPPAPPAQIGHRRRPVFVAQRGQSFPPGGIPAASRFSQPAPVGGGKHAGEEWRMACENAIPFARSGPR